MINTPFKFSWHTYNTDKIYGHGYEQIYEKFLDRDSKIIVEFGSRFGSAKLWRDYFPGGKIYCLDIVKFTPPKDVYFLNFDMSNSANYSKLPANIDVVIEDGPHTPKTQLSMLENIIPKLSIGGIVIFEDLHCTEEIYPEDLKKHNGDSDITVNRLLREWAGNIYKDYKYIKGSLFQNTNLEIFIERGNKIRWPHMKTPSEVIVLKKLK